MTAPIKSTRPDGRGHPDAGEWDATRESLIHLITETDDVRFV